MKRIGFISDQSVRVATMQAATHRTSLIGDDEFNRRPVPAGEHDRTVHWSAQTILLRSWLLTLLPLSSEYLTLQRLYTTTCAVLNGYSSVVCSWVLTARRNWENEGDSVPRPSSPPGDDEELIALHLLARSPRTVLLHKLGSFTRLFYSLTSLAHLVLKDSTLGFIARRIQ